MMVVTGRVGALTLSAGMLVGIAVAAGFGAGVLLGAGSEAGHDPALLTLLRFMAVTKATMVAGVAAGAAWRLRSPAVLGVTMAYAAASGIMAAGLWPIWTGTYVALGAILVHGGLAAAAVVGWLDRSGWQMALRGRKNS